MMPPAGNRGDCPPLRLADLLRVRRWPWRLRLEPPNPRGLKTVLRRLWSDQDGLSTVEYAILLALIVASAVFAWQGVGATTEDFVLDASGGIANLVD